MRRRRKKQTEFSKEILNTAKTECWIITAAAVFMSYIGRDTTIFCYLIPVCWGGYAIARAFYYNKAKAENAIKLRQAYQEAGLDPAPADEQFESAMNEEIQSQY